MITQLYGEAGSGKTQTAMLFALGVHLKIVRQYRGIQQLVIYHQERICIWEDLQN
jgi:RecA/RadA recombinase